jgi:4'-phosphopantetheinyl transferase
MTLQIPFSPPPENLQLANGEVHVFYAVLDQPLWRLEQLAETLSADERQRASRFHFGKDKYRYVAGRGMLREFLGRMLGANPNRSTRTRCNERPAVSWHP